MLTHQQVSPANVPQGPGVLEAELNGNANCIGLLENAITDLETNLRNVLRSEPPQPAPPPTAGAQLGVVTPTPSPMVQEVQKQRAHVEILTARVDRLRERLEA